jgi:hypothetical protein
LEILRANRRIRPLIYIGQLDRRDMGSGEIFAIHHAPPRPRGSTINGLQLLTGSVPQKHAALAVEEKWKEL